jgi:hypothetical protein
MCWEVQDRRYDDGDGDDDNITNKLDSGYRNYAHTSTRAGEESLGRRWSARHTTYARHKPKFK